MTVMQFFLVLIKVLFAYSVTVDSAPDILKQGYSSCSFFQLRPRTVDGALSASPMASEPDTHLRTAADPKIFVTINGTDYPTIGIQELKQAFPDGPTITRISAKGNFFTDNNSGSTDTAGWNA